MHAGDSKVSRWRFLVFEDSCAHTWFEDFPTDSQTLPVSFFCGGNNVGDVRNNHASYHDWHSPGQVLICSEASILDDKLGGSDIRVRPRRNVVPRVQHTLLYIFRRFRAEQRNIRVCAARLRHSISHRTLNWFACVGTSFETGAWKYTRQDAADARSD